MSSRLYNESLEEVGEMFAALQHHQSPKRLEMFRDLSRLELEQGIDPENVEEELLDHGYTEEDVERNVQRYRDAGLIDEGNRLMSPGYSLNRLTERLEGNAAPGRLADEFSESADRLGLEEGLREEAEEAFRDLSGDDFRDPELEEEISKMYQSVANSGNSGNRLEVFMRTYEEPQASDQEIAEGLEYSAGTIKSLQQRMAESGLLEKQGDSYTPTEAGELVYHTARDLSGGITTLKAVRN